jgi:organic radical activating enzyme
MNILATQYSLITRSFEVYISGCKGNPHCSGCHSKESWDFDQGEKFDIFFKQKIHKKIKDFSEIIDSVWILGGEPLDNDINQVYDLSLSIHSTFSDSNKKLWLFTRYEINEVELILKKRIYLFDYIKCGRYIKELSTNNNIQYNVKLASSNQYIKKIK